MNGVANSAVNLRIITMYYFYTNLLCFEFLYIEIKMVEIHLVR